MLCCTRSAFYAHCEIFPDSVGSSRLGLSPQLPVNFVFPTWLNVCNALKLLQLEVIFRLVQTLLLSSAPMGRVCPNAICIAGSANVVSLIAS
jgi:hypothetical protein